jgi:hypothetical protein
LVKISAIAIIVISGGYADSISSRASDGDKRLDSGICQRQSRNTVGRHSITYRNKNFSIRTGDQYPLIM